MTQSGRYAHGEFCWADLACGDLPAAKRFYSALFGWGAVEVPAPGGGIYTLAKLDGADVGGMHGLAPGPSHPAWTAYVAVDDCAASTTKAASLGGSVLMPAMDIADVGRMAVIADPEGAVLSLWQADSPHPGFARLAPRHGTVVWNELASGSAEAAKVFYGGVFGWGVEERTMPDFTYTEWLIGDRPVGGMLPLAAIPADVPPHWLVYFAVDDCDAVAARAEELGGKVLRAPFDVPNVGRLAVLADDQGAVFAVIRLSLCPTN